MRFGWSLLVIVVSLLGASAHGAEPAEGVLPVGADGKPLNLDFETGTLDGWLATGEAFAGMPVEGDTVYARRRDMRSQHQGKYWVGSFERKGDGPEGTLTSAKFKVTYPYASFLLGGGRSASTRFELVRADSQEVVFRASADDQENMRTVVVDLRKYKDQEIFIRLVDENRGGWGHINFDNFRFHTLMPKVDPKQLLGPTDVFAHSGLMPDEAAQAMTVPEGFSVTLFAGEPDVHQPIAMALDDRGRLWVVEAYTYPIRKPDGEGRDRVIIFEDADGDGKFDSQKVFMENLNLVSGLEVGYGGVWIGAAPHLLFIPDRDGDDKPDGPPEVLLDGWGLHDTHETLNAFIWGPDGWLYGCHGVFTHSLVGKPGTPRLERKPINAGIWRYHPTRHQFEVFAHGTSNPWGVDFNDQGQAVATACVIPHLFHIIQGARYHRQAGEHFNRYTYDDIKTIADHVHWIGALPHAGNSRSDAAGGGHAHSGAMIYLGGSWPEEYRNAIFMNNIHGARINRDVLEPRGSGYVGHHGPDFLLANDSWSQILNLRYGPNGQVYMIDWYDQNQCHRPDVKVHDRTNGRIFTVRYGKPEHQPVDLKKLSDKELVDLQTHANDWFVRHARRILAERGPNPAVHDMLVELAFKHPDETRRLRGLWALHVTDGLTTGRLLQGLNDAGPHMRGWCIQLALEKGAPPQEIIDKLVELARHDPSPVVRLYIASGLIRIPTLERRKEILTGLISHAEDADDYNLPLMYWYAAESDVGRDMQGSLDLVMRSPIKLLASHTVRRIAADGNEKAISLLVDGLARQQSADDQLLYLQAINTALKGRRQVPMPEGWSNVQTNLSAKAREDVKTQLDALGVTFGDPAALAAMRGVLADSKLPAERRQAALDSLLGAKDKGLAETLQVLIREPSSLRAAALRALATYDDQRTPEVILGHYKDLTVAERRDALITLASRPGSALALLAAVANSSVPRTDLSADIIRQLRNLDDPELNKQIADVWGVVRDTAEDKEKLIAKYKAVVAAKRPDDMSAVHGRAIFAKTCQQCHKLFGAGATVGPELTGSNRADLNYLLSNVLDPSAVMAKEYIPTVFVTDDGRVITGIVKEQTDQALTIVTANETVVLPRDEIDEQQVSEKSMMPDDLLQPLTEDDVRSLVAYVSGASQVPMLATAENCTALFNGQDLAFWQGNPELWSVEDGQIVGRSTTTLDHNEWLKSDLFVGDFRLTFEVLLKDNRGNSGVQFRSDVLDDGNVRGYQADIGPGWWGKLYEEHGRGLLWTKSGEEYVRSGQWNQYVIVAEGSKIRTWINGQLCVDLDDPSGAPKGIIALQLHAGEPTEVRFRNFVLEVAPASAVTEAQAAGGR